MIMTSSKKISKLRMKDLLIKRLEEIYKPKANDQVYSNQVKEDPKDYNVVFNGLF